MWRGCSCGGATGGRSVRDQGAQIEQKGRRAFERPQAVARCRSRGRRRLGGAVRLARWCVGDDGGATQGLSWLCVSLAQTPGSQCRNYPRRSSNDACCRRGSSAVRSRSCTRGSKAAPRATDSSTTRCSTRTTRRRHGGRAAAGARGVGSAASPRRRVRRGVDVIRLGRGHRREKGFGGEAPRQAALARVRRRRDRPLGAPRHDGLVRRPGPGRAHVRAGVEISSRRDEARCRVVATRLHGISTSQPRRRRDPFVRGSPTLKRFAGTRASPSTRARGRPSTPSWSWSSRTAGASHTAIRGASAA